MEFCVLFSPAPKYTLSSPGTLNISWVNKYFVSHQMCTFSEAYLQTWRLWTIMWPVKIINQGLGCGLTLEKKKTVRLDMEGTYIFSQKSRHMIWLVWSCFSFPENFGYIMSTKVYIVKAMVVMNRYEHWTIKKSEHWRIDAFELWCWRRLLRVPLDCKEIKLLSHFSHVQLCVTP